MDTFKKWITEKQEIIEMHHVHFQKQQILINSKSKISYENSTQMAPVSILRK